MRILCVQPVRILMEAEHDRIEEERGALALGYRMEITDDEVVAPRLSVIIPFSDDGE